MARDILSDGVYLGYDGQANSLRSNPEQKFQVWFDPAKDWGTLRQESIKSAQDIRARTDKEIIVLYSGGLDSEWTLESFRLADIKVTPLIVVYENDLNIHDVNWAVRYLDRNASSFNAPIWHRINLREWFQSQDIKELARTCQTPELAYTAQFKSILDNNKGGRVFITSYDEPLIVANDGNGKRIWELTYAERHYSVVKFFNEYEIDGCSNWSRQSASLFAAYVTQPQWQMLSANLYQPQSWNSELVKIPMYQYSFMSLESRPKYTGFEGSLDFIVRAGVDWKNQIRGENLGPWTTEYREDIRSVWSKLGVRDREN